MNGTHSIYPFLYAAYPVLFLYATNFEEALPLFVVRAVVVLLALTLLLLVLARLVVRDGSKAAVLVTVFLAFFFAYQAVYGLVDGLAIGGLEIGRHRFMIPGYTLAMLVILVLVFRTRRNLAGISQFLAVTGVVLVGMSLLQIGAGAFKLREYGNTKTQWSQAISNERKAAAGLRWAEQGSKRDIYYIILDGYARQDVLKRDYDFDNSEFIDYLRDKGFYVADRSRSNYTVTWLSVSSSLNYDFVNSNLQAAGAQKLSFSLSQQMIGNNKIARVLKDQGYKFVFLPSGFTVGSDTSHTDVKVGYSLTRFTELDAILTGNSLLWGMNLANAASRRLQVNNIETLMKIPQIKEPTFTFIHFACPHPPFLFGADGSCPKVLHTSSSDRGRLYLDQLIYTNKLVEKTIDHILAASDTEPIIIVQSDHGPDASWCSDAVQLAPHENGEEWPMDVRTGIINAYHFPGPGREQLYDSISPINSFRIVLNQYFGGNYNMLEDVVYYHKGLPEGKCNLETFRKYATRIKGLEVDRSAGLKRPTPAN